MLFSELLHTLAECLPGIDVHLALVTPYVPGVHVHLALVYPYLPRVYGYLPRVDYLPGLGSQAGEKLLRCRVPRCLLCPVLLRDSLNERATIRRVLRNLPTKAVHQLCEQGGCPSESPWRRLVQ